MFWYHFSFPQFRTSVLRSATCGRTANRCCGNPTVSRRWTRTSSATQQQHVTPSPAGEVRINYKNIAMYCSILQNIAKICNKLQYLWQFLQCTAVTEIYIFYCNITRLLWYYNYYSISQSFWYITFIENIAVIVILKLL